MSEDMTTNNQQFIQNNEQMIYSFAPNIQEEINSTYVKNYLSQQISNVNQQQFFYEILKEMENRINENTDLGLTNFIEVIKDIQLSSDEEEQNIFFRNASQKKHQRLQDATNMSQNNKNIQQIQFLNLNLNKSEQIVKVSQTIQPQINQLSHNIAKQNKIQFEFSQLFNQIIDKHVQGLKDLQNNFENLQVTNQQQEQINSEIDKMGHCFGQKFMPEIDSQEGDQDINNQFISEEFGTHQHLEEVRNYCSNVGQDAVQSIIKEEEKKDRERIDQVDEQDANSKGKSIKQYKSSQKGYQQKQSGSKISQRAHSPINSNINPSNNGRIRSAISRKNSDGAGSEEFNLDLTIKTRNSKNPFNTFSNIKHDSLMYSAQSDFGFRLQSPQKHSANSSTRKNQKLEDKKKLTKIQDDFQDQPGSIVNLDKCHSQKLSSEPENKDQNQIKNQEEQKKQQQYKTPIKQYKSERSSKDKKGHSSQKKLQKFSVLQNNTQQEQSAHDGTIINEHFSNFDDDVGDDEGDNERDDEGVNEKKQSKKQNHQDEEDEQQKKIMASADLRDSPTKNVLKKRVETQSYAKKSDNYARKKKKIFNQARLDQQKYHHNIGSRSNIFSTQISSYQNKIQKLKEAKELKKKKLQFQLAKINRQINVLNEKQSHVELSQSPHNKDSLSNLQPPHHNYYFNNNNNYASRISIADDLEAKKKAERLVKNLRSQKRSRNIAKIGEFKSLDKNINDYMEQLNMLRAQNEEKIKQKKKIQILERMKVNQIRKMNDKKKKQQSQHFVMQLKDMKNMNVNNNQDSLTNSRSNKNIAHNLSNKISQSKKSPSRNTNVINTKNNTQQNLQQMSITPQLYQKKVYLNKIRSFSIKKPSKDLYQHALS